MKKYIIYGIYDYFIYPRIPLFKESYALPKDKYYIKFFRTLKRGSIHPTFRWRVAPEKIDFWWAAEWYQTHFNYPKVENLNRMSRETRDFRIYTIALNVAIRNSI